VMIVNGAQHGLAATLAAMLQPGDALATDALTYPGIKALAHAHRLTLYPLPLLESGVTDLDALQRLCKRRPVRAIYTMPTLHNPLGSVMPTNERARLVALADRHDLLIIEDGAYAFLAEPAPKPVFTLAPHRTVYVSGLSKSVAPGLRVGFVAAPKAWLSAIEHAARLTSWSTPTLTVALACRWIESGVVDRLEDEKRQDARQRQRIARRALHECELTSNPSSYYLWLSLPDGRRAEDVVASLGRRGVLVASAETFATTTQVPQALRLALGSVRRDMLAGVLAMVQRDVVG
jgi:DNA-binding transcriptional MocR family regulator